MVWGFFSFFLVFSENFIYYSIPECTKLLSCAYYVGGSFYMILFVLYKNWGVLWGIEYSCFFNNCYFLLFYFVFFDV